MSASPALRAHLVRAAGAAALLSGRRHKFPHRLPRQQRPTRIMESYAAALDAIMMRARPAVDEMVPQILALLARRDAMAVDAGEGARAKEIIEQARRRVAQGITPSAIEDLARRFSSDVEDFQRGQLQRQVHAAFGADVFFRDQKLRDMSVDFTHRNVALITTIPDRFHADVESLVHDAIASARPHPALAEEIERRFQVGRDRARLIARDQVGKYYGAVNATRQQELGVERFVWRTVHDDRVRDEHDELDGETFDYDDPPDEGLPGEPINCRCYAEPVLADLLAPDDDPGDQPETPASTPDDDGEGDEE